MINQPRSFTQIAGIEALKGPQNFIEQMVAEFKQRRDAIVDGLNAIKWVVSNPQVLSCISKRKADSLSCEALAITS